MEKTFYSIIGGKEIAGSKTYKLINPCDQSVVANVSCATQAVVQSAVTSSRAALLSWKQVPITERAAIISRAASNIVADQGDVGELHCSEIMELIITEMGKSIYEAEIEIFESADILNYFANEGINHLSDISPALDQSLWATKTSKLVFEPVGVVGVIKPWNYPLELPLWTIGAALLAGNTVVFKPSEVTSGVGCFIERVFRDAGLPDGVLNVILGEGDVGEHLLNANIDMVSFTGSTIVGRAIHKKCAEKMIKCSLELGGKDAFIVCDDADIERAANGAVWGAFANAGQVCVAGERFYIHKDVYDEFIQRVIKITENLRIGSGQDTSVDIAPLAFEKQFQKVSRLVSDAVSKGAKVLYGGHPINGVGYYYKPTILENITADMQLSSEEIFGPIMPVYKVNSIEEAISAANDSDSGLGASVWSRDLLKAESISRAITAGMVWINDVNVALPQCPWGGVKQSGIGQDLSQFGIYEYINVKHICIENSDDKAQPWWYPYKKD